VLFRSLIVAAVNEAGRKVDEVVQSKLGNPCTLKYRGQKLSVQTKAGETYNFDSQLKAVK